MHGYKLDSSVASTCAIIRSDKLLYYSIDLFLCMRRQIEKNSLEKKAQRRLTNEVLINKRKIGCFQSNFVFVHNMEIIEFSYSEILECYC